MHSHIQSHSNSQCHCARLHSLRVFHIIASMYVFMGHNVICKSSLHHPCIIWMGLNMLIPTSVDTELTGAALQAMWALRDPVDSKALMLPCCNDSNSNNMIMGGISRQMISYTKQVLERGKNETNRGRGRAMQRTKEGCLEFIGCTEVIYILPYWDSSFSAHI